MELTNVPSEFGSRYLNDGFSGGEKKRLEILQLALQQPRIAVLDETDSGLDIDALNVVAHGVNTVAKPRASMGVLIITHYQRILHLVQPDRVSIMFDGRIVKEGGPELVDRARGRGLRLDQGRGGGGRRRLVAGADATAPLVVRGAVPDARRTAASPTWTARATSQTPRAVLDAMDDYYRAPRVDVHRGVYPLAAEATELFEGARARIAALAGLGGAATRSSRATRPRRSTSSPHAGAAPRRRRRPHPRHARWSTTPTSCRGGCSPRRPARSCEVLRIDDDGELRLDELDALLAGGGVKVVAVAHVSNVVGTINPVAEIVRRARAAGAISVIDGSQAVPQIPGRPAARSTPTSTPGPGTRPTGPTGVGVLHGRRELLQAMPPWLGGGHMIHRVTFEEITWAAPPGALRGGHVARSPRPSASAPRSTLLDDLGMDAVRAHERELTAYALERLGEIDGPDDPRPARRRSPRRAGLLRARRASTRTTSRRSSAASGVCVRAGHHCAQPLMRSPGRSPRRRAPRSPCTPRARRSTRWSTGLQKSARSSPSHGRPVPREDPPALQAAAQLGPVEAPDSRVRGPQPPVRRPLNVS